MQNTIVKEFVADARVIAAVMNQAEPRAVVETFWRNVYLRGLLIYDEQGHIAGDVYAQPQTGLPFGRGFLIGPDQRIVLAHFGHDPSLVIDAIYELLRQMSPTGDLNCDGRVDFGDINPFVLALTNPAGYGVAFPHCEVGKGDINGDGLVDFGDINPFVRLLTNP
jgi:hypothetical protein